MFIFWGAYNREKIRGVVADKCVGCGQVTVLSVSQIYRVSHLYYIPLGSGELTGTLLRCTQCGFVTGCRSENYTQFLINKEAAGLRTDQILQRTNARLAKALDYRAKLEQETRAIGQTPQGGPDPRFKLALARLAEQDLQDPGAIELHARLVQWGTLEAEAQSQLLRDLDAFIQYKEQHEATVRFVQSMGQSFKPEIDAGLTVLTMFILTGFGIAAAWFWLPENVLVIGIFVALLGAVLLSSAVHHWLERNMLKRFFRNTFLPEAQNRGVDVDQVLKILEGMDRSDRQLDKGVRGLAKAVPVLKEVLATQDHLEQWE